MSNSFQIIVQIRRRDEGKGRTKQKAIRPQSGIQRLHSKSVKMVGRVAEKDTNASEMKRALKTW